MTEEERENQDLRQGEKTYPNPGRKTTTVILILLLNIIGIVIGVLIRIFAVDIVGAIWDVALKSVVNTWQNAGLAISAIFSVSLILGIVLVIFGSLVEIVFTEEGIIFKRARKTIIIKSITSMKEASRGKVLKLIGLTSEGKTVNQKVSLVDIGKNRWEEFKKDMEKYITVKAEE